MILSVLLSLSVSVFSQKSTSEKIYHINGGINLTNNGISLIPSFSLGKPAVIFDLSVGNEKFSFDPQFRFDIENARPWAFIFWFRHKTADNEKFKMHIGAHPALMYFQASFLKDGLIENGWEARRFVAAEISPTIDLTKFISLNPYYLIGQGFDYGLKSTHYLAIRAIISNIGISEQILFSCAPELYYLKMDEKNGFYFASAFSIKHKKMPFSLAAMLNKKIESQIDSKDFIWNLSLIYSFGNKFYKNHEKNGKT